MIFKKDKKMWILENSEVVKEMGINLSEIMEEHDFQVNKAQEIELLLEHLSTKLYHYIYSFNPSNKFVVEYCLNYEKKDFLKECLKCELEYLIKNGDFYNWSGVSQVKGQINDINEIRNGRRAISFQTEMLLNSERIGQYPLLFQGEYPYVYKNAVKEALKNVLFE